MKKTYDSVKSAFSDCSDKYKYVLVYMMSQFLICDVSELSNPEYDEVLEARFFDEKGEAHICIEDGEIVSYISSDDDFKSDESREYTVKFCDEFESIYSAVKIKKYYSFDEDGQIYNLMTRCCGLER